MIQNARNTALSELFSGETKVRYFIPKYQREYIWSKWNWESLFDDVEESKGGHYLGSIICINQEKDSILPANIELVDGQQRMTTISIMYLAIYKYLKDNISADVDIEEHLELLTLRNRFYHKESKSIRLTPSISNNNLDDYKYIFSSIIPEMKNNGKPKFLGNRQISRAYTFFTNRLNSVDEDGNPIYDYDNVKCILDKMNNATLVKIDVATHADAFTLFETLNNRGVPLSAIDLIKNKLLGQLDKISKDGSAIDENFIRWNKIIQNLTDDYNIQERFLRHFYNAFRLEDRINAPKISKALRSNLIRIYEELIDKDVNYIFDRLEEASIIYSSHIKYDNEENSKLLIKNLRNLENVNGTDAYMLLLFVVKKFNITELQKVELVNLLCKFSIRRNVTDTPPTRDLTNYFMDMIFEINNLDVYDFEHVKNIIVEKGKPATIKLFEEKLRGDLYEENVGATRYILSSIELSLSETNEIYTNFYDRNKNAFIWTVEHVFPQGEDIPKDWIDMIANSDKSKAEEIRKSKVHKLGNLTLTGNNPNLSNLSLQKKQDKKNSEGKFIGFKNGLSINSILSEINIWDESSIDNRTDFLVKKALEIFEL